MERLDHTNLDFERLSELCSPFVQDLVVFVVTNMHAELEAFLKAHCQAVDDDEELHKHRYWDMFQDYSRLLESKLSIFVEKHNMTAHSFYAALNEAQTKDPMAATIIQYLLGATEYRRFVDLLIDRKLFHFGPGSDSSLSNANEDENGAASKASTSSSKTADTEVSSSTRNNADDSETADFSRKMSEECLIDDHASSKEAEQNNIDVTSNRK